MHDRYLIHDIYHTTVNLSLIQEKVFLEDIIKYVQEVGRKQDKTYDREDIINTVRYMIVNNRLFEHDGAYKAIFEDVGEIVWK